MRTELQVSILSSLGGNVITGRWLSKYQRNITSIDKTKIHFLIVKGKLKLRI